MSEDNRTIHQRLVAVMRSVGAIDRDKKVEFGKVKYDFRSAEAVYNRVQPLFAEHGIFCGSRIVSQDMQEGTTKSGEQQFLCTVTVEFTFFAEDGTSVVVSAIGQAMDTSDKGFGKAQTYASKTAICQMLSIPYKVVDPDETIPAQFKKPVVTFKRWKDLKRKWYQWYAATHDAKGADETVLLEAFRKFLAQIDEAADPQDYKTWTTRAAAECEKVLDQKLRELTAGKKETTSGETEGSEAVAG